MALKKVKNPFLKHNQVYKISGKLEQKSDNSGDIYNADFETAISATKLGKFNIILFLLSLPAGWTAMFENTTMSYVFPAAHCDLQLSLADRGSLNAITFVGMVSSGFIWGFLYDTFGRKKLMVFGYLLDACLVIMSSFVQSLTPLLVFKFFGGFVGIIYFFLPESPKFLMSVGRNEEALEVFRKVYSFNTGKSKDEFPIKSLVDETVVENSEKRTATANRSTWQAVKEEFQQLKPLCIPPYVKYIILICALQAMLMMCFNTLRLWLPQIFQSISDYKSYNNDTTSDLCTMLSVLTPSNNSETTCHVNFSPTVYTNNIINAVASILGYIVAALIINKMGKKLLLSVFSLSSGICAMCIFLSEDTTTVVALSSLFLASGGVCGLVLVTIAVDLFPTSLRAITISLMITAGTGASMLGNFIFPLLLLLRCAPPFFFIGAVMIICSIIVVFLPSMEKKALK